MLTAASSSARLCAFPRPLSTVLLPVTSVCRAVVSVIVLAPQFSSFVADVFAASGVQHYRVTHDHDPVPHLPPLAFGFHHQPKEVRRHLERSRSLC